MNELSVSAAFTARSSGSALLDDAWASFWQSFTTVRDLLYGHSLYDHSSDTRTGGNFLLHQLLYVGHSLTLQPDQRYPTLYGRPFQWPAHNTYGLPSPDNTFGLMFLDGRETYRLWGKRNTVYKIWMVVYHGFFGDENPAQMAEMQIDDFSIEEDGSFEIIISADRHEGNWIEIDPASRNVPIMLRQNHLDWTNEIDAEWHVERIDIATSQPSMILDEAEVAHRIKVAGRVMVHMAKMSCFTDDLVLKNTQGTFNTFVDLTGPDVSKYGTFNRAHYGNAVYEVGEGEALVLTIEQPDDSEYWNVQIGDIWYQIEDYVFHQTSLNQLQARRDSDGRFRLVIAHDDPGVANWLQTSGRDVGVLVWRVYGPRGHVAMPSVKRVAMSDLRAALPADTPQFSAADRAAQLEERRKAGSRRWEL